MLESDIHVHRHTLTIENPVKPSFNTPSEIFFLLKVIIIIKEAVAVPGTVDFSQYHLFSITNPGMLSPAK